MVVSRDARAFLLRTARGALRLACVRRDTIDGLFSTDYEDLMEGDTMITPVSACGISLFVVTNERTQFTSYITEDIHAK